MAFVLTDNQFVLCEILDGQFTGEVVWCRQGYKNCVNNIGFKLYETYDKADDARKSFNGSFFISATSYETYINQLMIELIIE